MAKTSLRIASLILITLAMLEGAMQLAFTALPVELIQRMPQYRERMGHKLETDHGAREYPALASVSLTIKPESGDLFRLTCLSTDMAEAFAPYTVSFQRDHHGFRNDRPWRGDIDLVVIGDSFTAAESVNAPFWQNLTPATLSLGLPGSGTLEQIRLLHGLALPLNPETVVLAYFGGNDLDDNLVFAEMQAAGMTWAGKLHANRSALDYLATVHLALYLRDALLKPESSGCHYPQMAHTDPPAPVAFFDDFLPQLALDQASLRESDMFQITKSAVIKLADELGSRGIRFIFLYIPQKAELYWGALSAEGKAKIAAALNEQGHSVEAQDIDANLNAQREIWHSIATQHGVELLDLSQPLAEAIAAGAAPYFFGDTHWNQLGHEIANAALRKSLD